MLNTDVQAAINRIREALPKTVNSAGAGQWRSPGDASSFRQDCAAPYHDRKSTKDFKTGIKITDWDIMRDHLVGNCTVKKHHSDDTHREK